MTLKSVRNSYASPTLIAGLTAEQADSLATRLGFSPQSHAQAASEMLKLYKFFVTVCAWRLCLDAVVRLRDG